MLLHTRTTVRNSLELEAFEKFGRHKSGPCIDRNLDVTALLIDSTRKIHNSSDYSFPTVFLDMVICHQKRNGIQGKICILRRLGGTVVAVAVAVVVVVAVILGRRGNSNKNNNRLSSQDIVDRRTLLKESHVLLQYSPINGISTVLLLERKTQPN